MQESISDVSQGNQKNSIEGEVAEMIVTRGRRKTYGVENIVCYQRSNSLRRAPEEVSKRECPGPSPGLHLQELRFVFAH